MQHTDLLTRGMARTEDFVTQQRWLEGEPAATFLAERWAKQPCAPSPSAGQKCQVLSVSVCHCGQRQDSERKPQVVQAAESQQTAEWAPGAACLLSKEPRALLSVPLLGKCHLLHVCQDMPPSPALSTLLLPSPRIEIDLFAPLLSLLIKPM